MNAHSRYWTGQASVDYGRLKHTQQQEQPVFTLNVIINQGI